MLSRFGGTSLGSAVYPGKKDNFLKTIAKKYKNEHKTVIEEASPKSVD